MFLPIYVMQLGPCKFDHMVNCYRKPYFVQCQKPIQIENPELQSISNNFIHMRLKYESQLRLTQIT